MPAAAGAAKSLAPVTVVVPFRATLTPVEPTAPPAKLSDLRVGGADRVAVEGVGRALERLVLAGLAHGRLRDSIEVVIAVMPSLADFSVWMPLEMPSSRLVRSLERLVSEAAVKKFDGLSSAELTFLPVARRPCVRILSRSAVCWRLSRLARTPAESVIFEAMSLSQSPGGNPILARSWLKDA